MGNSQTPVAADGDTNRISNCRSISPAQTESGDVTMLSGSSGGSAVPAKRVVVTSGGHEGHPRMRMPQPGFSETR